MIARLGEISWHFPWALALALTPLLIHAVVWSGRKRVLNYADVHLRPWAVQDSRHGHARQAWSGWLLWTLLALAVAGPRVPQTADANAPEQILRRDVNVMVVLNVAASMERASSALSPLARSKLELSDLLARLQGERIGLIVFAGSAGLVLPPTYDYELFSRFLELADASLVDGGPADIGAGLRRAQEVLLRHAAHGQAVLLITDAAQEAVSGERGAQALRGAQDLKNKSIKLTILDVTIEPTHDMRAVQEIAAMASGKVVRIEDGDGEWRTLYDETIRLIPSLHKPPRDSGQWIELYPWLLLSAALILLVSAWNIRLRNVVLLALALVPSSVRAEVPQPEAYNAFRANDYARAQLLYAAQQGYAARFGEGASAYRRKDYEYAVAQFALALIESRTSTQRADALFNLGNARFMQGRFDAALEAYRDASRYRQNDLSIEHNRELALTRLATQRRARNEGVPGRRGTQVGGGLGEDITNRAVGMEEDRKTDPWMSLDDSISAQNALRGRLGDDVNTQTNRQRSNAVFPGEARIAAKKIEMLSDEPKVLLTTLLKFEERRRRNASAEK